MITVTSDTFMACCAACHRLHRASRPCPCGAEARWAVWSCRWGAWVDHGDFRQRATALAVAATIAVGPAGVVEVEFRRVNSATPRDLPDWQVRTYAEWAAAFEDIVGDLASEGVPETAAHQVAYATLGEPPAPERGWWEED